MPIIGSKIPWGYADKCDYCSSHAKQRYKEPGKPWRNFCNKCAKTIFIPEYQRKIGRIK